ncbi:MAG: tetratricopeptide repeat protein [Acidobacteria bacterium]|nr:tetratricopeptide repeat protein [Acidobacteriota bacterium]
MITVADKANLGFLEDALAALDSGRYAEAIVTFEVEGSPVSGLMGQFWRAEVALYLDRLEAAADHLAELGTDLDEFVADEGSLGTLSRRKLLVRAEIAHFRGEFVFARDLAAKAAKAALLADDASNQIRAFIDLGRIARNQGDYTSAVGYLSTVHDLAKNQGTPFQLGLVKYFEGTTLLHTGRIEEARDLLQGALDVLVASENLRYAGMAYGVLGSSLCDLNRADEGVAMLEAAEKIAADLGIARDMMPVANNIGRAMLVLGRPAEAERRLADLIGWERLTADSVTELDTLVMLTVSQIEQRKFSEARASAEELARLGATLGLPAAQLDGEMQLARISSKVHDVDAVERLRAAVRSADSSGTEFQRLESRVYLAESLVVGSTVEAKALTAEVLASPIFGSVGWLKPIVDRISSDLERVPIRIDGDSLIIDSRLGFPNLKDAREAVERFLFDRSMRETGGNASAAGRLIGASPFQMHCLGRALQGLPTRPGRNPDPDAPVARRRPRKLHWKK